MLYRLAISARFQSGGGAFTLEKAETVETKVDDKATFKKEKDQNGVGLYLVVENLDDSTNIQKQTGGDIIDKKQVTPAAPFFVTLPMTNPTDLNSWMYTVHVYPKNQVDSIKKSVDDSQAYSPTATKKTLRYLLEGDITDTGDVDGDSKVDHKNTEGLAA